MAEVEKKLSPLSLPGPLDLAKESFGIYKKRFWILVGVFFLSVLYILGYFGLAGLLVFGVFKIFEGSYNLFFLSLVGLLAVGFLAGFIWLSNWIQASYIVAIAEWQEKLGIRASFKAARVYIWPLFITTLIAGLLVFGGIFLFVLPGILLSIWFSYSQFTVICENKKGLLALHASREFFRGRFWRVIWREIAVRLPEILLGFIVGALVEQHIVPESINAALQFVSILLIPFYMIYTYVLYTSLRKTTPETVSVSQQSKKWYIAIPIIGFIFFLLTMIGLISAVPSVKNFLPLTQGMLQGKSEEKQILEGVRPSTAIVYGLVSFHNQFKEYPATLDQLVDSGQLEAVPTDPKSGESYRYVALSEQDDFSLCTPASVEPEQCVTSASSTFDL